MTPTELALDEVAAGLNALALAVLALVIALIVLSWSVEDMSQRIHLFGFMVRRLTRPQPADSAVPPVPSADAVPPASHEAPAAQKAAKARSENHAQ